MYSHFILFQLFSRYIGDVTAYGRTELLPGSYIVVFTSRNCWDLNGLEILAELDEVAVDSNIFLEAIRFVFLYGKEVELQTQNGSYESSDITRHFESRHGINVFSKNQNSVQIMDSPVFYFFPRRVFKLKKLIPPNPDRLVQ